MTPRAPGAAEPCAHGSQPAISCSTLLEEQWTDLSVVRSWPAEDRSPPPGQQCGSTLHRGRKQEGSIKVRTLHFGGLLFWSQMPVVHVESPPRHGWGPLVAGPPPPPPPPQDDSGGLLPLCQSSSYISHEHWVTNNLSLLQWPDYGILKCWLLDQVHICILIH